METKKYNWIQRGFAKGIDPDKAIKELERIETVFGSLTAETVLNASTPKDALLHPLFTWDDAKAAHAHRLQQARLLINNLEVKIISDGQEKTLSVYEIVKGDEGRVYKNVQNFSTSDIQQVKNNAIKSLNFWKNKLAVYKNFDTAVQKIDEAVGAMQTD